MTQISFTSKEARSCATYLYPLSVGIFPRGPAILRVVQARALCRPAVAVLGRDLDLVGMNLSWFHAQRFHTLEIWREKWGLDYWNTGTQEMPFFQAWQTEEFIHSKFYERSQQGTCEMWHWYLCFPGIIWKSGCDCHIVTNNFPQ